MTEEQKMIMELQGINPDSIGESQLEDIRNDKAFISNDIINALFQSSTMTSFKVMFYIARISNNMAIGEQIKIVANLKDFLEYTRMSKETLDDNISRLQKTLITFYSKESKKYFSRVQLIGKATYMEDGKHIELYIDNDVYIKLKETQEAHTEFNVPDIMRISQHKHSIRILMLLNYINGFTTERKKSYTLKQLNYMFDTNYINYSEFSRKILDQAKEELENIGLISFDYVRAIDMDYLGKGRKPIKHITIIPIVPEYTEPNIYAYIEQAKRTEQEPIKEPKLSLKEEVKIRENIKNEIDLEMFFAVNNIEEKEIKDYYYKKEVDFIDYCIQESKKYKDYLTSFLRYIEIAKQNSWNF